MRLLSSLLAIIISFSSAGTDAIYQGCTPADPEVRDFLGVPATDSIDFIRWKVVMHPDRYNLSCEYGISRPNTNGFIDGKKVAFSGPLSRQGHYYRLQRANKAINILEVNPNIIHLLDKSKTFMVGNGGYSYALNSPRPVKSRQVNFQSSQTPARNPMVFQGRTPCQELAQLMARNPGPECIKMKWYVILYMDSTTGKPSYYLQGGRQYRKATMTKGNWEMVQRNDGRIMYKLYSPNGNSPVYLLKADDNILFFTDPEGNLLVGNEDFSYTLNATADRESK